MGARVRWGVVLVVVAASFAAVTPGADAQLPPIPLFPPPPPPPPPSEDTTPPPSDTAPPPAPGAVGEPAGDGDGVGLVDATGAPIIRVIPPEALAFINSIVRSAPSNNAALVQGVEVLVAAGADPGEAARVGYGRFPVAGYASWSDDWLMPRWTGLLFRYHEGCDVFAAYGTPVQAPVDGVARIAVSSLGGLTVSVYEPDGTYYYLAHLSGVATGLVDGQAVRTGDVVGYVGDSGNALGGPPHLHLGIYPGGGAATAPKPVLDQFLVDALTGLATLQAAPARVTRGSLVATGLVRALSADAPTTAGAGADGAARTDLLWASAASPAGGGLQLVEAQIARMTAAMDWEARSSAQASLDLAWARSAAAARTLLAALTPAALVAAMDSARLEVSPGSS